MRILDINGKEVAIGIKESTATNRSEFQAMVELAIRDIYPRDAVIREFNVPGSRLSVDFFIPRRGILVEAQGKQHYTKIEHFHGANGFGKQVSRDRKKQEWADLNGFLLIEIPYNVRTRESIRKLIRELIRRSVEENRRSV